MAPAQRGERSALTLLALAGIGRSQQWSEAERRLLRTVDIMQYMHEEYGKRYAANSRETIRRQTLHQFVQACIAEQNPDDPHRPTNSGNNCYALTGEVLPVLRSYGSKSFADEVEGFLAQQAHLRSAYERRRASIHVPVSLPDGTAVELSPGLHNELQRLAIESFAPRFAPGAVLLYLGDTARKQIVVDERRLRALGITITEHDKLPDIILHDAERNWLFLVEAVTSHGPMTRTRYRHLTDMLASCGAAPIFVSAFATRGEFRRWVAEIAWETEVWIAAEPEHLIHFDGDKFLGPFE